MIKPTLDLEALIDAWRGSLVGLLAARGATWDEAQELAQDVFAEAWLSRDRFRGDFRDPRAVGRWLAGIARNLHRISIHRRSSQPTALEPASLELASSEDPEHYSPPPILTAIERLPERERVVIQAFYLEETPAAHVAALLGISTRAVEGLLRRARQRLYAWVVESQAPRL